VLKVLLNTNQPDKLTSPRHCTVL